MLESITQSMLNSFLRCPTQWEFRYVKGIILPPGIAARTGSSVHEAARINHKQKITTRTDLPVSDLQDASRDYFIKLVKDGGVFIPKEDVSSKTRLLNDGLNSSISLTKLYSESLAPKVQPIMAEDRLEVDVGLTWPLSGGIDAYTEDKWLVDMKTSGKSKTQNDADTSLQLSFYAGLLAHTTGEWPSKVSLEVLIKTKEPKHQSLESHRGQANWENLLMRLQLMEKQILAGLFPPCSPDSWSCNEKWCGFYNSCKYSIKKRG